MVTHESVVNWRKMIRDLAEMYTFDICEVVVTELLANALDAGAICIAVDYDPDNEILVVTDNGKGMTESQFREYHNLAADLKTRGSGIGFAGVGAKISFNVADRVVTETRSESFHGGSNWYLSSEGRLVWDEIQPSHLDVDGTRVEVHFRDDSMPPYSVSEDIIQLLQRHYLPLFDSSFLELYERMGYYTRGLRFIVNGQPIVPGDIASMLGLEKQKRIYPEAGKKRIGYGIFGLAALEYPLGSDLCGVVLCTHGKVIKPDLLNQFPGSLGPRVFGLVEVPNFVEFLTTSKTDFIRGRGKHKKFESLYDPIRQEFKAWLIKVGIQPLELTDTDEARKLEKELAKLLEDVPELGEFFGFRTKKPVLQQSDSGAITASSQEGVEVTFPLGGDGEKGTTGPVDVGTEPGYVPVQDKEKGSARATPISRTARRGPRISFVSAPDRLDLAWVEGNCIVVNSGHPSYSRIPAGSAARRVHCLFAIGTAVQRFIATADERGDLMFIDRLMAAWGKK